MICPKYGHTHCISYVLAWMSTLEIVVGAGGCLCCKVLTDDLFDV